MAGATLKLKGAIADKVKQLLGEEDLTQASVARLLEELEVRRAIPDTGEARAEAERIAVDLVERRPADDDDPEDDDEDDDSEDQTPPAPAPESEAGIGLIEGLEDIRPTTPTEALMFRLLMAQQRSNKMMQAKLDELVKPRQAEDTDRAIGDGKLPVVATAAPPLGFSGPLDMPVGVWFQSPLGPRVQMKLCACPECKPYRLVHYYCVVCRRGPFAYQGQQGPKGRKSHTAPGSVWGVSHESCSQVCYQRYQELLGVVPGVNDMEPPRGPGSEADLPDPRAMAIGSD